MSVRRTAGAVMSMLALCATALTGCGAGENAQEAPAQDGAAQDGAAQKIEVVCATFPAYDWVTHVVGGEADRFEVTYLMDGGVDLHSYQPNVEDMAAISDADLFVYVGGESDEWAADAVATASNPNQHALSMLEAVGDAAVEEEVVEGMEADEEAEGEEAQNGAEEEGPELDEHVWLSLKNAQTLVGAIADELGEIDPASADAYASNAAAYAEELASLDARFADAMANASQRTVVFADRFPFRYLVDDYGISYYAAFVGCSAETEASFETVAFLAQKVDELGLSHVLVIENSDQRLAQTVVESTTRKDQAIEVMDSLQSVSADDVEAGKTYVGAMEGNLAVLTKALG